MADCDIMPTCIFFNDKMANMSATAELYKKKYCRADNSQCARYMVLLTLGKEKVPADLYPHEVQRAKEFIKLFQKDR